MTLWLDWGVHICTVMRGQSRDKASECPLCHDCHLCHCVNRACQPLPPVPPCLQSVTAAAVRKLSSKGVSVLMAGLGPRFVKRSLQTALIWTLVRGEQGGDACGRGTGAGFSEMGCGREVCGMGVSTDPA